MILDYNDFLLEGVFDKIKKNNQFINDLDKCVQEMFDINRQKLPGSFSPFWTLMKKYPDILKKIDLDKGGDYRANLHNKNKIPKRITFTQSLYFWLVDITDVNKIDKIEPNFTEWFFNKEIEIYRGFSEWYDDTKPKESLIQSETEYKSFTMKFDIALNFTQSGWVNRAWINKDDRNGWIIKTKIKPCDVYMFSNDGFECECILKQPVNYTGYFKIKKAEIVEDINY